MRFFSFPCDWKQSYLSIVSSPKILHSVLRNLTPFPFLVGTKATDLLKPLSALTKQTISLLYKQVSDSELKSHKRFLEEVAFTGWELGAWWKHMNSSGLQTERAVV